MRVMILEQDKEPYVEKIWNDLDSLSKKLGSKNFEVIEYENILVAFCTNGLADNLPINRYLNGLAIRGNFVITGNNTKELDFQGLSDEQIEKYTEELSINREEELEL